MKGGTEGWGNCDLAWTEEELSHTGSATCPYGQKLVWNASGARNYHKAFGEDRTTLGSTESNPRIDSA